MNKQQQQQAYDGQGLCCFHPRERVVGVCAHCLKERLHLLLLLHRNKAVRRVCRTNSISLPKQVLALGSSFLQRLDSRQHQGPANYDDDDHATSSSAASLDDSFISIKFEDNGKATWDRQRQRPQQKGAETADDKPAGVVLVEHVVKRGTRWRKQVVGRLLQLARWPRRSAAGGGLDAKKQAKSGRGWIRSLTRRRAGGDRACR